jgi:putative addiction module component (TIGR02574 family)
MTPTMDKLLGAALQLPEPERAELVELLAASMDSPASQVHPAWASEVRRRAAELESGQVQSVPLDEAVRLVREQLNGGGPARG